MIRIEAPCFKCLFENNSGGYEYKETDKLVVLYNWGIIKNLKIKTQLLKPSVKSLRNIDKVILESRGAVYIDIPKCPEEKIYFTKLDKTNEKEFKYLIMSWEKKEEKKYE